MFIVVLLWMNEFAFKGLMHKTCLWLQCLTWLRSKFSFSTSILLAPPARRVKTLGIGLGTCCIELLTRSIPVGNPKHAADVYFLKHNKQFVKRDCGFTMTTGIPSPQKRYHKRSFSASTAQEYIPTAVYGRAHIPRSISKRHDTVSRDILYISVSARSETRIKLTLAPPIG